MCMCGAHKSVHGKNGKCPPGTKRRKAGGAGAGAAAGRRTPSPSDEIGGEGRVSPAKKSKADKEYAKRLLAARKSFARAKRPTPKGADACQELVANALGHLYRRWKLREPFLRQRAAAVVLQAKHRQRFWRQQFLRTKKAITWMQAKVRGWRATRKWAEDTGQSVDFIVEMRKKNAARFKARQRIAFLNLPETWLKIKLLCAAERAKKICEPRREARERGWMKANDVDAPAPPAPETAEEIAEREKAARKRKLRGMKMMGVTSLEK